MRSLTTHCKDTCVRAAVTRSTTTRRKKKNERQHMHGPTGMTPGELAAPSLSFCAHMCFPCISGVLEPDQTDHWSCKNGRFRCGTLLFGTNEDFDSPCLCCFLYTALACPCRFRQAFFVIPRGTALSHTQKSTRQSKCAMALRRVDMRRVCVSWGCRSGSARGLHPAGPLRQ